MDAAIADWLSLAIRWAHIITGIAWIGSSFYFVWLDSHLEAPAKHKQGVEGEIWMVHSGGFYEVNKITVVPEAMPKKLHWFVWEATFTWITGALLMVVIYYFGAEMFMVDRNVADISPLAAVAIGVGTIAVAWFAYDFFWATRFADENEPAANALFVVVLVGLTIFFTQVLSGRAAFIHTGALMGTLMAANVWRRIIPAQRALIAARTAGTDPDPAFGKKAKQRSMHNNYMTLPVVFCMFSAHYPMTFRGELNWLILLALFAVGAAIRHYFNLAHIGRGREGLAWAASAGTLFVVVAIFASGAFTQQDLDAKGAKKVAFLEVHKVISKHCVSCHATTPSNRAYDEPPKGVVLTDPAQIRQWAKKIKIQTVDTKAMPLGNTTKMTDAERRILGIWVLQGARLD